MFDSLVESVEHEFDSLTELEFPSLTLSMSVEPELDSINELKFPSLTLLPSRLNPSLTRLPS